MSKSRGNVVNPDSMFHGWERYGALLPDVRRTMGTGRRLNDNGIAGINRWLNRVRAATEAYTPNNVDEKNSAIYSVYIRLLKGNTDIDKIRYNTMISTLMEYTNYLAGKRQRPFHKRTGKR